MDAPLLRNLNKLIRESSILYRSEFECKDVQLSDDFKLLYKDYLQERGYEADYYEYTTSVISSSTKYIFVPNQWFVIASYAKEVVASLLTYQKTFDSICDSLSEDEEAYAKSLRGLSSSKEKERFCKVARRVIAEDFIYCTEEQLNQSVERMWRFVSDYVWWSGKKTVDRRDFYVSVVLNMLNLVNVSQGFVADIAYAYATDRNLYDITEDLCRFTKDYIDSTPHERKLIETDPSEEKKYSPIYDDDEEAFEMPTKLRIVLSSSEKRTVKNRK